VLGGGPARRPRFARTELHHRARLHQVAMDLALYDEVIERTSRERRKATRRPP